MWFTIEATSRSAKRVPPGQHGRRETRKSDLGLGGPTSWPSERVSTACTVFAIPFNGCAGWNRGNQRKHYDSSSRFKGTSFDPAVSKWYARCTYKRLNHNSGYCETDEAAARAYDVLAVAWFGEFARLSFPREWTPERRAQVYAENAKQREEADKGKGKSKKGQKVKGKTGRAARKGQKPAAKSQQ